MEVKRKKKKGNEKPFMKREWVNEQLLISFSGGFGMELKTGARCLKKERKRKTQHSGVIFPFPVLVL